MIKEAQASIKRIREKRRVRYTTLKKQAAIGNEKARLRIEKKKASEHRNFRIRQEAQRMKNTSAREAKATKRLEIVRAQYAAISEQRAVANAEARLRNEKRKTDQQRTFKNKKLPNGVVERRMLPPEKQKQQRAIRQCKPRVGRKIKTNELDTLQ